MPGPCGGPGCKNTGKRRGKGIHADKWCCSQGLCRRALGVIPSTTPILLDDDQVRAAGDAAPARVAAAGGGWFGGVFGGAQVQPEDAAQPAQQAQAQATAAAAAAPSVPARHRFWDQLSLAEKAAAQQLGWSLASWDADLDRHTDVTGSHASVTGIDLIDVSEVIGFRLHSPLEMSSEMRAQKLEAEAMQPSMLVRGSFSSNRISGPQDFMDTRWVSFNEFADTILSYNEVAEADADPDMPPYDVKQLLAPFDGALSAAFDQAEISRRAFQRRTAAAATVPAAAAPAAAAPAAAAATAAMAAAAAPPAARTLGGKRKAPAAPAVPTPAARSSPRRGTNA